VSTDTQITQLEKAIYKRAQTLADTHLHAARQHCDRILVDANRRLRQQEEREIALAKVAADQTYRRHVQASEIRMQAELDQLRWSLVQSVMSRLEAHLKTLTQQQDKYIPLLKQYFKNAALALDSQELVAEVNANDYVLLSAQWEEFVKDTMPDKKCELIAQSRHSIGGLLVRHKDNRVRVDNTFEGVLIRLENELYQIITAQLFATTTALSCDKL
jgi:V/A-type H+-transporting ATPase subunit E